jgi:hypothetical protein
MPSHQATTIHRVRPEDFNNTAIRRAIERVALQQRQRNSAILHAASIATNKQLQLISEAQRKQMLAQVERAVEQSRPNITKVLAGQNAQHLAHLRRAIGPIDISTIARVATEQLRLANEPAIKQVALAAIHEDALRAAGRQASKLASGAMVRYDWRAISGSLISEASTLLVDIGAEDRFDQLKRAAEMSVATAPEQGRAGEPGEEAASHAREGDTEEDLRDLITELITEVRKQREETRDAIAKGPARDAVNYISLVFQLVTVLLTLGALIVAIATYGQGQTAPVEGPTIVIEAPDSASPKGAPTTKGKPAHRPRNEKNRRRSRKDR